MSLTSIQRDQARYKGGDEIRKRKSYLKRSATAIRQLATESEQDWSALRGVFTDKELNLIRAAAMMVDRATQRLADDIREADRIRAQYDKAVAAARKQLSAIPLTGISDIVAILAADNSLPGYLELDSLRTTRWLRDDLMRMARAAVDSLARTCARLESDPAAFTNNIIHSMHVLRVQHAGLITELNALAVQAELERANRNQA